MKRSTFLTVAAAVMSAVLAVSFSTPADALLVCAKDDGTGNPKQKSKLFLKNECVVGKEVRIATAPQLAQLANDCPPDSVSIGTACVDTYEGSVWSTTDAATIQAIRDGTVTSASDLMLATQHGVVGDDYGAGCPDTAAGCTGFYAVSIPGVLPSSYITWFQAQAACRNAGKRLATNEEWQAAAYGTPDGVDDESTLCNFGGPPIALTATGSRSACVSDVGAYDMVGNLWELVGEWSDRHSGCTDWTTVSGLAGADVSCFGGPGYHETGTSGAVPGAVARGGFYSSGPDAGVFAIGTGITPAFDDSIGYGLRCAR